jgi:predicted nucleic acid-binding protein
MTAAALPAIPAGGTILLDTSAVLAYLAGTELASAAAAAVIDGLIATGQARGVVSAITLTESLVRPLRARSTTAVRIVEDFLLRFPNLDVEPMTIAVAREAARIRAATAVRTPDAIILATAVHVGATVVVCNDRSWPALAKRAGLAIRIALLDRTR